MQAKTADWRSIWNHRLVRFEATIRRALGGDAGGLVDAIVPAHAISRAFATIHSPVETFRGALSHI